MPKPSLSKPDNIQTVEDIAKLLLNGESDWGQYGRIRIDRGGSNNNLILFNYSKEAFRGKGYTQAEILCRGLIINEQTGEIVARPFDKFFNYGENGISFGPTGKIVNVYEKIDGNLGILYRDNGLYKISTRGKFRSEAASWATDYLNKNYDLTGLEEELTLIFEIISPLSKVIVDYEGLEDLVLIAARNRFTGKYVTSDKLIEIADRYKFSLPDMFSALTIENIIDMSNKLDSNAEGYVVEYDDGSRWKIKGKEYRHIAHLIITLSFRNTVRAMQDGVLDKYISLVPEKFMVFVREWIRQIEDIKNNVINVVQGELNKVPADVIADDKKFAMWVKEQGYKNNSPQSKYIYAMRKGKDITRDILNEIHQMDNQFINLTDE